MQAGQQAQLSLLSRAGAARTILLGQSFNFACALQKPWAKLRAQIGRRFGLRPFPESASELALAQAAQRRVPVQGQKQLGGGGDDTRAGLHPLPVPSQSSSMGAYTPSGIAPSIPPAAPPGSALLLQRGRGADSGVGEQSRHIPPKPPRPDTHAFQRLYPSESQRLENSSYSNIFIFFGYNFSFGHVIN